MSFSWKGAAQALGNIQRPRPRIKILKRAFGFQLKTKWDSPSFKISRTFDSRYPITVRIGSISSNPFHSRTLFTCFVTGKNADHYYYYHRRDIVGFHSKWWLLTLKAPRILPWNVRTNYAPAWTGCFLDFWRRCQFSRFWGII